MKKKSFGTITIPFAIIFLIFLMVTFNQNQNLKSEKELLLLKNDSLHVQHLKSRKELEILRNQLDSIRHKK